MPVIPALENALPFLPSGAAGGCFASCVNFFFCEIHLDNFLSICYNKSISTFHVESEVKFMKETYVSPELEVVEFDCEDVITTSGVNPDENELPIVPIG